MKPTAKIALSLIVSAALIGPSAIAAPVAQGGHRFEIQLTDEEEVGDAGLAGGEGTATLTINPGQQRVCYEITVNEVVETDGVIMAHIHEGPAGIAGGIVVTLFVGDGPLSDCVTTTGEADRRELSQIIAKPHLYYVNVHSTSEPGGAVRGQLQRR